MLCMLSLWSFGITDSLHVAFGPIKQLVTMVLAVFASELLSHSGERVHPFCGDAYVSNVSVFKPFPFIIRLH